MDSTATPKPLRVLISDDHEIVRMGIRKLVESHSDWEVVGEAKTGREAVAMAQRLRPDVIVMDYAMPELNGLEATRQIKRKLPETEIAMLTAVESEQMARDVFMAGGRAYLLKCEASLHLTKAIEALGRREAFMGSKTSKALLSMMFESPVKAKEEREESDRLSARQREIVQLLCAGKSNKEVASLLNISVRTAETHRAAVMRKLEVGSLSELVLYAVRNGIVEA